MLTRYLPRFIFFLFLCLLYPLLGVASAQNTPIDKSGIVILVKSTLIALDQANKTGNYTVFRDLSSDAFRKNTASDLAGIFAQQRADAIDMNGVIVLEPAFTPQPFVDAEGKLHVEGYFPSTPLQLTFSMSFVPQDRLWKLFSIGVDFQKQSVTAPETAGVAKDAGKKKQAEKPVAPSEKIGK